MFYKVVVFVIAEQELFFSNYSFVYKIKPLSLALFCLEKGVLFNLVAEDGFEPPTLKV